MCGPSGSERQLASQSASFSNTLQQDFNSRFAGQNEILQSLNNNLSNLSEGIVPQGFDPKTLAALNTSAIDTTGANYANAARAVGGQLAGRGGDSGLESGVDQQIKAGLASSAAGQLSTQQQQIQLANNAAGREDLKAAIGGEAAAAGIANPLGFAGATTSANSTAYGEANQNAMASSQQFADIAGGIAGVAKAAGSAALGMPGLGSSGGISSGDPEFDLSSLID